ncbi:MAG: HypC/HybG/HupF family hydrogenase formation chaperone [Aquabacterium sp.]|nr:HypC/HybG/HupF family hydrogenase formation chaperone [Aquabacterium sp.]
MCLALPARVVVLLPDDQAVVELGGVRKTVSVALTPEAQVGDYVIVHVGHAIGLIDAAEAERTLALFAEMAATLATQPEPNA